MAPLPNAKRNGSLQIILGWQPSNANTSIPNLMYGNLDQVSTRDAASRAGATEAGRSRVEMLKTHLTFAAAARTHGPNVAIPSVLVGLRARAAVDAVIQAVLESLWSDRYLVMRALSAVDHSPTAPAVIEVTAWHRVVIGIVGLARAVKERLVVAGVFHACVSKIRNQTGMPFVATDQTLPNVVQTVRVSTQCRHVVLALF
ncbi:MAG: hypothetical protein EOP84_33335 [Verrucomicrobiaceae bacterium]|nr:MAG: hypothetical protein EOP84_33335 [Verrucomicrobiaceae bacterium]